MNDLISLIKNVKIKKDFNNTFLLEKSFFEWSEIYLKNSTVAEYRDQVEYYCRIIESIEQKEIQKALEYKKMQKLFTLLDRLQLACNNEEQKLFAIPDLRITYYSINPFIYGLMLFFYDSKEVKEIDSQITLIAHWLDDIIEVIEKYQRKNKKK